MSNVIQYLSFDVWPFNAKCSFKYCSVIFTPSAYNMQCGRASWAHVLAKLYSNCERDGRSVYIVRTTAELMSKQSPPARFGLLSTSSYALLGTGKFT